MKKKPRESHGGNWMDTYGDMVTLLLCFFVLLFSMSTVNEEKLMAFIQSFSGRTVATEDDIIANNSQIGDLNPDNSGGGNDELPQSIGDLANYLQENVADPSEGTISVSEDADGTVHVTFMDNTLFDPNRYTIRAETKPYLDLLGKALKNVEGQLYMIETAGYVADTGIRNSEDWHLSSNRAAAVASYIWANHKLPYELMVTIGHGANDPIGDNKTEEGRKKNRRVVVTIVGKDTAALQQAASGQNYDKTKYPASGNGVSPYKD